MIFTHRQRARVAQREPATLAQKSAVRIRAREFLQTRFSQTLQPRGNFLLLLLQTLDRFPAHLHARSLVGVLRVALLLPSPNVPPYSRPFFSQRLLAIQIGRAHV